MMGACGLEISALEVRRAAAYKITCDPQAGKSCTVIDPAPEKLVAAEAELLLRLARSTLVNVVTGQDLPRPDPSSMTPRLVEKRGCFATLRNQGELRGCIGSLLALKPLFEGVMESVCGAAGRDRRFRPVSTDELEDIRIELSILSEPVPFAWDSPEALLQALQPQRHGVWLRIGNTAATFLPQVWADIPDREEFMARLCAKAGLDPQSWRSQDACIAVYEAEVIEENPRSSGTLTVAPK